jgi:hypothetical protein
MELTSSEPGDDEGLFKAFWRHSDAILCCAWKVYIFFAHSLENLTFFQTLWVSHNTTTSLPVLLRV